MSTPPALGAEVSLGAEVAGAEDVESGETVLVLVRVRVLVTVLVLVGFSLKMPPGVERVGTETSEVWETGSWVDEGTDWVGSGADGEDAGGAAICEVGAGAEVLWEG